MLRTCVFRFSRRLLLTSRAPVSFQDLGVRPELIITLKNIDVHTPHAVQAEALQVALRGEDLRVCAWTGSGKSLLFMLPILQHLAASKVTRSLSSAEPAEFAPEALILVPSHELALQVSALAAHLAAGLPEPPGVACLASDDVEAEVRHATTSGARLAVSTPGAMGRAIRSGLAAISGLQVVAIDEADALLADGGGGESESEAMGEVTALLEAIGCARAHPPQLILTMATLNPAQDAAVRARFPSARRVSHAGVLPPTLRQSFQLIPHGSKQPHLLQLLRDSAADQWLGQGSTMVFCAEEKVARELHTLLANADDAWLRGLSPGLLTEGTPVRQRSRMLNAVREGECGLLVCTDVASRGLDFPQMRHVIMYDLPDDAAKFIHRAGRTARVGREGHVTCLVQSHEVEQYRALHEGEALPGTALHRAGGRAGVAMPDQRASPAKQRGWLALGDLGQAGQSAVAADSRGRSADFASAFDVYTHGEDDDDPRLRGPPPAQTFGRLKDRR